jgi:hypothetical protein
MVCRKFWFGGALRVRFVACRDTHDRDSPEHHTLEGVEDAEVYDAHTRNIRQQYATKAAYTIGLGTLFGASAGALVRQHAQAVGVAAPTKNLTRCRCVPGGAPLAACVCVVCLRTGMNPYERAGVPRATLHRALRELGPAAQRDHAASSLLGPRRVDGHSGGLLIWQPSNRPSYAPQEEAQDVQRLRSQATVPRHPGPAGGGGVVRGLRDVV